MEIFAAQRLAEPTEISGGLIVTGLLALALCVFEIVACWKVFEKAGEKGWKVLIPFYNLYIMYKIVGMKKWFWITLAASVVIGILIGAFGGMTVKTTASGYSQVEFGNPAVAVFYAIDCIFALVISIMFYVRLSKVFGHGIGFTLGLIFLSGIFVPILAFGQSKYNKKLAKSWEK